MLVGSSGGFVCHIRASYHRSQCHTPHITTTTANSAINVGSLELAAQGQMRQFVLIADDFGFVNGL
jgi:hypothetical protein